ncbi:universal stress protein [Vibrio sp. CAU 1672]|uniref:universal stress protein n=1 Tax=Vibrio sp. CAU 1672 TaxID=3032594 RepID=UPI0023DB3CB4|nr:universal stress protein [Vibrio sp. CAU 1672]MDF2156139.1 universal stress protein [Vibrio sp. CAU 1672]
MSYKHILVAVDVSHPSQTVIDKAIALAKNDNSKLSFVFVDVDRVALTPKEESERQQKLRKLADNCDYPVDDTYVVIGDLHIKLAGMVKDLTADLLVCGHHHQLLRRLFSSVPKLVNAVEADLFIVYLDE